KSLSGYHQKEHSLEIQLPFIRKLFPTAKILPIMIGQQKPEVAERLAKLIYGLLLKNEKKIVVLVSTDLSHYHSAAKAKSLDKIVQDRLLQLDGEGLWQDLQTGKCEACGIGGLLTVIAMAQSFSSPRVEIISYTHSGVVTGDAQQVVGYLSARISS
ncbi:MAG TPA: AmmeMemoRadiSam system protein B, partial [Candidatus Cloacimonadota bacterium]|nr:AmmeMemoRadiSam system protein B [Candidatus Cloacimonadota bacterium]